MKVTEYKRSLQWVGDMQCSHCSHLTPAWRSSGMSQCSPHFYCNRCSNVIYRRCDQELVWEHTTQELLEQIAGTLPDCPCGGRFAPGANPKCAQCGRDLAHQDDTLKRLTDPHMIAIDGACVYSDDSEPYQVRIVD